MALNKDNPSSERLETNRGASTQSGQAADSNRQQNSSAATRTEVGDDYPHDLSLCALFERQAQKTPNAVALITPQGTIRYAELEARANRLAGYLKSLGVNPEILVGVYLDRSVEFVVSLLAIFKANGAYLPLDPSYPSERLAHMIGDAQPHTVLTRRSLMTALPAATRTVCADDEFSETTPLGSENAPATESNLAYVIYTSGSTGVPKGVAVEHRQILNRLYWMWKQFPFAPDDVGCFKTSINFVDSIWETFGYLLQGIPTVIVDDDTNRDLNRLVDLLAQHRVTRIWVVPSFLRTLLNSVSNLSERLPALKFWSPGGEPLTTELVTQFQRAMPHAHLLNLYGLSETWDALYADIGPNDSNDYVPIGRPISNVQVYILDDALKPVAAGEIGELHIAGAGLARGYRGKPELTDEKFIRNPFSDDPKSRLYKTGDYARYRADGQIEYRGRRDHQVKIRGHRIELGEIESRLNRHSDIDQSAVLCIEAPDGDKALVAYIVCKDARHVEPAALRQYLSSAIPPYMIPQRFVLLPSFPLTPSGKVDRLALSKLTATKARAAAGLTATEQRLSDIWKDVLGIENFSVNDDFFLSGGQSLKAMQLMARIDAAYSIRLPARALYEHRTLGELAKLIDDVNELKNASLPSSDDGDIEEKRI